MSTIAVILARGGSKGLPNKSALPLADKPVLAWTIEHALGTPALDRVLLSTDSDVLARIARKHGIDVVLRPPQLCTDTAAVADAVRFTVEADEAGMFHWDHVAVLYGNVPVRPTDLTARALDKLRTTGCDSVQSVAPVGKRHPYWMKTVDDDGTMQPFIENSVDRRQDLPGVYALDGGIIALTRESLFTLDRSHPHTFLGEDRRAITTREGDVLDIDTPLDLLVAEAILKERGDTASKPAATKKHLAKSQAA